jgi:hypothetical protein
VVFEGRYCISDFGAQGGDEDISASDKEGQGNFRIFNFMSQLTMGGQSNPV